MTGSEYEKAKNKWLDDAEDKIGRSLSKFERDLLDKIIEVISQNVRTANGQITDFDAQIYNRIAEVFSRFDSSGVNDIIKEVASQVIKAIELNRSYITSIQDGEFTQISEQAKRDALRSVGIVQGQNVTSVTILPSSPISLLLSSSNVRTRIVKVVMNAVNGGLGLRQTLSQVREVLQSTSKVESTFIRYYKGTVFDILTRTDRIHNKTLSEKVGLTAFIYAGTVIEETRCFCEKNKGKVFLVSEAEEWKDLIGTKCGPIFKKNGDYKPLINMGGYYGGSESCRHNARFISNTEALRRRDDLKVVNGRLRLI